MRPIRSERSQPERVSGKVEIDDVVRRVELERVLDGREGVGVGHLPDRLEPGLLELAERVGQALVGVVPAAAVVALLVGRLRADHDEPARPLLGLALEVVDQLATADGLVGHHERALDAVAL